MDRGVKDRALTPVVIAAHELKTPLILLRQLSLGLQDESLDLAARHQLAYQAQLVSERALRLTSDITKAERLEDALFEMEPVSVAGICREVVDELAPLYRACGRSIEAKPRRQSLLAVANRDLLRRVVLNFADNALQYSSPDSPVELSYRLCGDSTLRLGVRDYGPALDVKTLDDIENRLSRAEVVKARPHSSGLGLSIVKKFAEAMSSEVGLIRHRDGATFYVDLPLSRQMKLI